jgi:peptide chain release factor
MPTIYLIISTGAGPEECAWAAGRTLEAIQAEARKLGEQGNSNKTEILEKLPSLVKGNIRSALIELQGGDIQDFADSWIGTILWIWKSEYRPHHGRKNWFVSVRQWSLSKETDPLFEKDVRFETARASGPGGQKVNKTETAVRAIHVPTGLSACVSDERSQFFNKRRALERLSALLEAQGKKQRQENIAGRRHTHYELERGNPIRIFKRG